MRLFIALIFIIFSFILGNELVSGEALSKYGSGKLSEEPKSYYLKVTFHGVIWLTSLVCLFLPKHKLESLNEWLKQFDSKYDKEE
ncbi:hypothetical protein [Psychrosphaera algicola]|uniref:Uncharacterized protein n=1 Tax=Psychrosphaera algicola TaxID=3023714 RepID=A0ABT5FFL9_9GAMM|nr:hypothetical protein [Psychrosphaera sp. G1-22]MDC2890356.1 hypothetical protein [Psychrosphaera sp. G1-22]